MAHKILCREELCWYSQSSASVGPILPLMLLPQYQKRSQQVKWYNQIMNPQQKCACLFAIPQPVSTWVKHFCQILLEVTGKCFVCLTSSHEMHNETRHATGYCAIAAWHHYCSGHNTGKKGLFFDCSGYSHTAEMGIKIAQKLSPMFYCCFSQVDHFNSISDWLLWKVLLQKSAFPLILLYKVISAFVFHHKQFESLPIPWTKSLYSFW